MLATKAYAAPVGGISYKSNTIRMRVEGFMPGKAPRVNAEPDGYFSITNDVATHARRRGRRIDVIRHLGFESLQLQGSVSRRFRGSLEIPVANPTAFAVTSFKQVLQARGIVVDAEVYDIDELQVAFDYPHADTLAKIESEPLSSIVMRINKESDNQYAEQIFRTFGWRGSAIGGERRTKQLFDEARIDHRGLSVRDGSGLSRKNLISARMLGELLTYMQAHPEAETFVNSLAVSGEEESTLERRLTKLDIKAKTGSLEYVRSLSGYVTGADGKLYAFTIIANNYTSSASRVRRSIDEIVGTIASQSKAD
jgi:D-alanyl-D-alanine carboxypeptidase/D-alanyl-D-alanine-endopeptidase (penicillin-binding protein 4)